MKTRKKNKINRKILPLMLDMKCRANDQIEAEVDDFRSCSQLYVGINNAMLEFHNYTVFQFCDDLT